MAATFSYYSKEHTGRPSHDGPPSVFVTGATGKIGSYFAQQNAGRYRFKFLVRDEAAAGDLERYGTPVPGDICSPETFASHLEGVDTVLHLAANADAHGSFQNQLEPNILGAWNVLTQAKAAGCRRVVFASSMHAVHGYPKDIMVRTSDPVNPSNIYGATKCFGEALSRYMAEVEQLSVIVVRIGYFLSDSELRQRKGHPLLRYAISHRDLNQFLVRCIDDVTLQFAILQASSNNREKRLDISDACKLIGYTPEDDAFEIAESTE